MLCRPIRLEVSALMLKMLPCLSMHFLPLFPFFHHPVNGIYVNDPYSLPSVFFLPFFSSSLNQSITFFSFFLFSFFFLFLFFFFFFFFFFFLFFIFLFILFFFFIFGGFICLFILLLICCFVFFR